MKPLFYSCLLFLFLGCERPMDCIESEGPRILREVPVSPFTRLEVYPGIGVEITQGSEYKVFIEAGENLINNVQVTQDGNRLMLRDASQCNWTREYGTAILKITAPNIEEIYSKTEQDIRSIGVLTFPILRLFALDENGDGVNGAGTGDFFMEVHNNQVVVQTNNVARFYLSGQTQHAHYLIWAGDSRVESPQLVAGEVAIFHRGSNDLFVHPLQKISGKIVSTGNVRLAYVPPLVSVETTYQGQLLYP
jgi:hypothetical protein